MFLQRLLFFVFFVSASAQAANDKAFFWQVSSDNATVYLMGSIHFADKSFYPLRQEIEAAFQRSEHLVVELDINKTDHAVYNRLLANKGIYKDGSTIKDVINEETWLQLRQHLTRLNVDYNSVKHYKPGILVLTLSAIQVVQLGFDPQLGIDVYFLEKASKPVLNSSAKAKNIMELETLDFQLNLFLDIPDGDLLLKESLYSLDNSAQLMTDLVAYWKLGDEKQMNKLLFEEALTEYPAFSEIYDSLFYSRNNKMADKIDAMLKAGGTYFVVIGSGHLIGEQGIVKQLKQKGYDVERR